MGRPTRHDCMSAWLHASSGRVALPKGGRCGEGASRRAGGWLVRGEERDGGGRIPLQVFRLGRRDKGMGNLTTFCKERGDEVVVL